MWTFIAVVAGLIAAALAGVVADAMVDRTHRFRPKLTALITGVIVFAGVQGAAEWLSQPDNTARSPVTEPTDPSSAGTTPSSEAPEFPPASTPPATTVTERPPDLATSLLDLPAVEVDTNSSIDLDDVSPIEINGTTYGRALVYECLLYCDGSSPQVREVTLGKRFNRFTATAAVLDTSTDRHRIDITLDSKAPKTFTTEPGQLTKIDLNVSGISRIRIQMYAPRKLKSPLQAGTDAAAGENGGGLPGIGLGDPLFRPAPA